MTFKEYFGDWLKVIDYNELNNIIKWLKTKNPDTLCPSIDKVFRAFQLCDYNKCRVVFIGQDPYPQKGVATGILFGNSKETPEEKLSPSLEVVRESVIDFSVPHFGVNFDITLEAWAKQGILMLNSALTCEVNKVGIHRLNWTSFMVKFLQKLSTLNSGIVYVLFGDDARGLNPYIKNCINVFGVKHPAYYARKNEKMPHEIWWDINEALYDVYKEKIVWFEEFR